MSPSAPDFLAPVLDGLDPAAVGARCLVMGGRGFVGQRLVEALVALGCEVVAVDTGRIPKSSPLSVVHKRVDPSSRGRTDDLLAFRPVDVVFHCGRREPGPAVTTDDLWGANVVGTATLLAAAREATVPRLVALGDVQALHPGAKGAGPYTRSMVHLENAVLQAHRTGRLQTLVIRAGTVWGAGGACITGVLHRLAGGNGAFSKDAPPPEHTAHVDSVVRALLLGAAQLAAAPGAVGGRAFSVVDAPLPAKQPWLAPLLDTLGYAPDGRGRSGKGQALRPPVQRIPTGVLDTLSTRRDLGFAPVVSHAEGMARLEAAAHTLHAHALAAHGAGGLPFRAPDFALVDDTVVELTFVAWDRRRSSRAEREARMEGGVAPALKEALAVQDLRVFVDGPHSRAPAPSPFPLGGRPVAGLVSLRTSDPDAAHTVEVVLSRHGFDSAGYRVAGSVFVDHGGNAHGPPRDWADGTRSPGMVMVGLAEKAPIIAYDDWLQGWFGHLGDVTAEVLPRARYVRQRVLEPVTPGAAPIAAIALESFPDPRSVRSLQRMYGATTLWGLVRNLVRVLWAARQVFVVTRLQTALLSETVVVSDFAGGPQAGGGPAPQ